MAVNEAGTFTALPDTVADAPRGACRRDTFDHPPNNTALTQTPSTKGTTEETSDRLMCLLLMGPYFPTQTLLPPMADGGTNVHTSSNPATAVTGLEPGHSAHASMKDGPDAPTRYMAKESSTRGIHVNAVSPGPTRTRNADDASTRHPETVPAPATTTAPGRIPEARQRRS